MRSDHVVLAVAVIVACLFIIGAIQIRLDRRRGSWRDRNDDLGI